MKYVTGMVVGVIVALFMIAISPLYAQDLQTFANLLQIKQAAEELVVKRGKNLDGTRNDDLYFRVGWDPCTKTSRGEARTSIGDISAAQYIPVLPYAESKLEDGEWTEQDRKNCPPPPLKVDAHWLYPDRPVYVLEWDEINMTALRGSQTDYRVFPGEPCLYYNVKRADGRDTSYWMLAMEATVYLDGAPVQVSNIDGRLSAVCEQDTSVPITDIQF
ncbi:MAG: hypothetical protein HKN43_04610 [Rhodothermales bacterium]|nr:hypothetical protein [Rhodothermales bacterium]